MAAVGEALEAELEGQDSSLLTAFSLGAAVGSTWWYLPIFTCECLRIIPSVGSS